jgi:hypothetical protein
MVSAGPLFLEALLDGRSRRLQDALHADPLVTLETRRTAPEETGRTVDRLANDDDVFSERRGPSG